jgi:hypothetical protein
MFYLTIFVILQSRTSVTTLTEVGNNEEADPVEQEEMIGSGKLYKCIFL